MGWTFVFFLFDRCILRVLCAIYGNMRLGGFFQEIKLKLKPIPHTKLAFIKLLDMVLALA